MNKNKNSSAFRAMPVQKSTFVSETKNADTTTDGGKEKGTAFTCRVCGTLVSADGAGTEHRNHCPVCLSSVHLDVEPGDRAADCGGIMEPIGVWVRKNGEWAVIHRCRRCGALSSNRIAADDDPVKLMSIAVKPLASPPFPLELLNKYEKFTNK